MTGLQKGISPYGETLSVLPCSVRTVDETSRTREAVRVYVDSAEQRDWQRLSDLLTEDMVYEMPQTRERIRGRSAFLQFNREYPGDWHLQVRRIVADGRHAAAWIDARVGTEHQDACVWFEFPMTG